MLYIGNWKIEVDVYNQKVLPKLEVVVEGNPVDII